MSSNASRLLNMSLAMNRRSLLFQCLITGNGFSKMMMSAIIRAQTTTLWTHQRYFTVSSIFECIVFLMRNSCVIIFQTSNINISATTSHYDFWLSIWHSYLQPASLAAAIVCRFLQRDIASVHKFSEILGFEKTILFTMFVCLQKFLHFFANLIFWFL